MRTMLVWRKAVRLPRVIDNAASTQSTGHHESAARPFGRKKPKYTILMRATNPPALEATDKNAVTGVGAPS